MNSEKWERAKKLYEAALKIGRADRPRFLAENSAGDEEVLGEVESLLACSDEASGFLETPAIGEIAESLIPRASPWPGKKSCNTRSSAYWERAEWAKFTWPKTPGCDAGSP